MEKLNSSKSELTNYNSFCKAAMLDSHRSAWKKRRVEGCEFAEILIVSEGHYYGSEIRTWWAPFVGIKVFARLIIRKREGKMIVSGAYPVRLNNILIIEGREISSDSFLII